MELKLRNCQGEKKFSAAILEHSQEGGLTHPDMRVENVKDGVGPVPLRLLQLAPDLLAARGAEHGDLLPGHGGAPLLHRHRRQRSHVRQRLLPLHGGVPQHLRV